MYQPHREVSHARTVLPATDIPRPPLAEQPPGKTPGSRRAFPAFRWPAPDGIAAALVLTLGTVEKHVASIFGKLGLPASETDNRRVLAALRYLGS